VRGRGGKERGGRQVREDGERREERRRGGERRVTSTTPSGLVTLMPLLSF
jgi:hypothetical protein